MATSVCTYTWPPHPLALIVFQSLQQLSLRPFLVPLLDHPVITRCILTLSAKSFSAFFYVKAG